MRKFLGYTRIDCREAVLVLHELYDVLCAYLNHFVPTRRTKEKVRDGAKYKRKYEKAQTAYRRALLSPNLPLAVKDRLQAEHRKLNPLLMKKEVDRLITKVFATQKRYGGPEHSGKIR